MNTDPTSSALVEELMWLRRQQGPFPSRLAQAQVLLDIVGRGNLRELRRQLERIRREHASDPQGDISAYFASAGYGSTGQNLDQRLSDYARRHFVVERTALRRSDRGARAIALLLRDTLAYNRPWAYLFAIEDGGILRLRADFVLDEGTEFSAPIAYVSGERVRLSARVAPRAELGMTAHMHRLPDIDLAHHHTSEESLARITVSWTTYVTPIWELVSQFSDPGIYGHFTVEPRPMVSLEVRRVND